MQLKELSAHASQLSEADRAQLASELIQSLKPPSYQVSDHEVALRIQEAESNPSVLLSHEEFISTLKIQP